MKIVCIVGGVLSKKYRIGQVLDVVIQRIKLPLHHEHHGNEFPAA